MSGVSEVESKRDSQERKEIQGLQESKSPSADDKQSLEDSEREEGGEAVSKGGFRKKKLRARGSNLSKGRGKDDIRRTDKIAGTVVLSD